MTRPFRSFAFEMRFDKAAITRVSPADQVDRSLEYLAALGELDPIFAIGTWRETRSSKPLNKTS